MSAPPQRNALNLTPRQMEIARLAARGYSRQAIARRLVISVSTVEVTLNAAFHATGIDGRGSRMLLGYILGVYDAGRPQVARRLCPALREEA